MEIRGSAWTSTSAVLGNRVRRPKSQPCLRAKEVLGACGPNRVSVNAMNINVRTYVVTQT